MPTEPVVPLRAAIGFDAIRRCGRSCHTESLRRACNEVVGLQSFSTYNEVVGLQSFSTLLRKARPQLLHNTNMWLPDGPCTGTWLPEGPCTGIHITTGSLVQECTLCLARPDSTHCQVPVYCLANSVPVCNRDIGMFS